MNAESKSPLTGQCLCGDIAFTIECDRANVIACHCGQCRQWSGHVWASINVAVEALSMTRGEDRIVWFRASEFARRGFCPACGSALFWHGDKLDGHAHRIAVAAGALDAPTGLRLDKHIFAADKGDYYDIPAHEPQLAQE
ncbi:MAG: GFA family protein [Pseudomonadota bacterium]